MKIEIDVAEYSAEDSLPLSIPANSRLNSRLDAPDQMVITGNPEGLRALGTALIALAGPTVPSHFHVHMVNTTDGWKRVPSSCYLK
jgi:hypothetical protein